MAIYQTKPPGRASHLQMLTRYKAWANDLIFRAVSTLPAAEIVKERQTLFKSMLMTLNHVYVVDDIFKAHLEGREHGYAARNTETAPALEDLWEATGRMDRWYIDLSDALDEDALSETVAFTFVDGGEGAMTRQDMLLHVVNHGTYHRGFGSDMMYQVPAKPPANDLPVFLRDVWNRA
ncbi:DinB family protein [Pelagibius sp.]|uniref:DinB family protein n=1 Tax=Pelagibius sp. TaxID=1931238 RepID=UPI002623B975|nr:DinB family protein [Pelagibius sp.]